MADDPVVQEAINLIKLGEDAHRARVKRYDRAYEIYRASEPRQSNAEPWQSKLRVPYAQQVLDTALVNIVAGTPPRCLVDPRSPEDEAGAKGMQKAQDYFVGEDHLVEKQPVIAQQGLIYGITVAKNHWIYKEQDRMGRTPVHNPIDGTTYMEAKPQRIVIADRPTLEPWNVYDAWWDPNARDVDSCNYFVLRTWARMDDLRAQEVNEDTGFGVYRNLDQLASSGPGARRDVSAQERTLGGASNKRKDMVELLEVWHVRKGQVYVAVIGNRKVLLRYDKSPYWHGKFPIVTANTRPDLFEIQGIPETELVDHLQSALWTVQNMRTDNMHMTVMRGITYREGGVSDPNSLVLKPRFKWAVSDHDDIKFAEIPPLPQEAYREEEGLLARMQLVTGINPYVSGADSSGIDQNTATGVSVLQEVASRLLRFKASQLQNKVYQRSFEMWGDMIQQYLDHDIAVKITNEQGQDEWTEFGPQDVAGHFHYKLEGSDEPLSKATQKSEAIAFLNALSPLAPLGLINWKVVAERVAVAFNISNPQSLFVQQQPQSLPPASPVAQPQQQPALQNGQFMQPGIANAIQQG